MIIPTILIIDQSTYPPKTHFKTVGEPFELLYEKQLKQKLQKIKAIGEIIK